MTKTERIEMLEGRVRDLEAKVHARRVTAWMSPDCRCRECTILRAAESRLRAGAVAGNEPAATVHVAAVGDTIAELEADGRIKAARMFGPAVSSSEMTLTEGYTAHPGSGHLYAGKELHASMYFTRSSHQIGCGRCYPQGCTCRRYYCTACRGGSHPLEADRITHTAYHHGRGEHSMCEHYSYCHECGDYGQHHHHCCCH
jgi:hypothetical protein